MVSAEKYRFKSTLQVSWYCLSTHQSANMRWCWCVLQAAHKAVADPRFTLDQQMSAYKKVCRIITAVHAVAQMAQLCQGCSTATHCNESGLVLYTGHQRTAAGNAYSQLEFETEQQPYSNVAKLKHCSPLHSLLI
jgi:hypothetical protein